MKKVLAFSMLAAVALSACAYNSKQPTDDTYYKKTQGIAWPTEQRTVARTTSVNRAAPTRTVTTTANGKTYTTTVSTSGATMGIPSSASYGAVVPSAPTSVGTVPVSGYASGNVPSAAEVGNNGVVWQDPKAPPVEQPKPVVQKEEKPKVAIPEDPGLKLQCAEMENGTYTCRLGNYICGTGCKSDGSNCTNGYCLQAYCDDVLGQKWELENDRKNKVFGCKHPSYDVMCRPSYGKINCFTWWYSGTKENGFWENCGDSCNANGTQCQGGSNNCWDKYRK